MNILITLIIVKITAYHYMWVPVNSEPFPFPYVPPDPFPVLVEGPGSELFKFTKLAYTTQGTYTIAYINVPASGGPTPHIHHWADEWFYFPEGGLVIYSSNITYPDPTKLPGHELPGANMHRYRTQPGDLIYSPRSSIHGYLNDGNITRPLICVWTPGKIGRFFLEAGIVVTDGSQLPPVDNQDLLFWIETGKKYGNNISTTMNEYVATWDDDWQPALGWNANGSELIKLLTGLSSNNSIMNSTASSRHNAFRISFSFIDDLLFHCLFYFLVTFIVFKT